MFASHAAMAIAYARQHQEEQRAMAWRGADLQAPARTGLGREEQWRRAARAHHRRQVAGIP